jgi:hypothetical protein
MKRARVVGLALVAIGVGQAALILAPGQPRGALLLALTASSTALAVLMAWRPEWADGGRGISSLQKEAGRSWFLLGGCGVVLGVLSLAVAVGSALVA